jgi:3,4-dihydroxy 2-butanone 4-phosphate synthase/GTP cyclohydrolase II
MGSALRAAVAAIGRGEIAIVVDDPGRENEGDLVMAADAVTPAAINFMATHGRGLICLPMEGELLDRLDIGPMVAGPQAPAETNFTVSIDLDVPGSTGISAFDRARTIRAAVADDARPEHFRRPGHVFPLRAVDSGVLGRRGHTEAIVDLARLARRRPAGVICEIMADDGTMARGARLRAFAATHGLPVVSIEELAEYLHREPSARARRVLRAAEPLPSGVRRCAETDLPTRHGRWRAFGYQLVADDSEQIAITHGEPRRRGAPLVRIHSECLTGDVFRSRLCDCGDRLEAAMRRIVAEGAGAIVYLREHEGRRVGVGEKLRVHALQDQGVETVAADPEPGRPVDARRYEASAQILEDLGLHAVRLLTDDPAEVEALEASGIRVVERVALPGSVDPRRPLAAHVDHRGRSEIARLA